MLGEIFALDLQNGVLAGRRKSPTDAMRVSGAPLIVCLSGGGYSSRYFDIPGYSLLDRAAAAGCTAMAFDRPGYGSSSIPAVNDGLLKANARQIVEGISTLWRQDDMGASGVFLIGHSIGGAIAILAAGVEREWPLLGLAISGIAHSPPPEGPVFEPPSSVDARFAIPDKVKNAHMFGAAGTYADDAPQKGAEANEPVVVREIFEINREWPRYAKEAAARVYVPVHCRLGDQDSVTPPPAFEIENLRRSFVNAPIVDAAIVDAAGHCIDFHHVGAAFQQSQIAFALSSATAASRRTNSSIQHPASTR